MADPDRTTPTSDSSWIAWQLMHLSFQLGFIKATANRTLAICEQMLMILTARPEPPLSGPTTWRETAGQIRGWIEGAVLLHKLWQTFKKVPWWLLFVLAKWLHLF